MKGKNDSERLLLRGIIIRHDFWYFPEMLIPIDAIIITSHDHSRPETDKEPDFFMHRFKVNVLMLAFRQFAAVTWKFQISRQIIKNCSSEHRLATAGLMAGNVHFVNIVHLKPVIQNITLLDGRHQEKGKISHSHELFNFQILLKLIPTDKKF